MLQSTLSSCIYPFSSMCSSFIKFRPENLNSRSILVWLFPSSLGNRFYRSGLILHSWLTGLRHRFFLQWSVVVQDQFRGKSWLCHCHACLSQKSICWSKIDPISFLSGMCTQLAISQVNCAVPIIDYSWSALEWCWPPDQTLQQSLWVVWMIWRFGLLIWPVISCQDVLGSKVNIAVIQQEN